MNGTDLPFVASALALMVAGIVNVAFPKQAVGASRRFVSILHLDRAVSEGYFSIGVCRFAGLMAFLLGAMMLYRATV